MISGSLGPTLLFVAFFVTSQILTLTRAAPIDCKNNTGSCFEEIMKQLTQVRFEVNILKGNRTSAKFKNCAELYKSGQRISGVYTIDPDGSGAFDVFCDQTTAGGGWTVFQKRLDGSVDFNRTWADYKRGFGNLIGEFWLGLDKIHRLARNKKENRLRVDLGTTDKTVHVEYSWFGIGNEKAKYQLNLGPHSNRTVHDSLAHHNKASFVTWDKDPADCPQNKRGGWWYDDTCRVWSQLNGVYPRCANKTKASIHWGRLNPKSAIDNAPKTSEMKIRAVDFP